MAGPTVLVRFIGDASGLTKATDQVERKNEGLRGSFKKVALAAAGAFVATHVVDFVKDSIKAGQDLNAAQSRTATIFGQSAGEVEKWGSTASKNLRLPKAEALGAANTIGKTLVGSFGMSEKSAAGMSMGVVNLAKDMATFNRVPFDEALQKVTGGLNGQTRGLKTLGVSMSATEIQAKALSMGFGKTTVDMGKLKTAQLGVERAQGTYNAAVKKFGPNSEQARRAQIGLEQAQLRVETAMKGGKTTLTASEKAQASYALMLDKTKLQQGANEKAGDSLKGQQERMRAEWTNAKATLGQALIPVLTQLATIFTEKIVPILQKAARFIKENSGWLIPLIGIIIGIIGVIKIWTAVQTALNLVMSANPIVLIVLAVIALVAGIIYLATKTQFFQTIWKAMTDAIAAAWNWVWGILKGIFNAIVGAFDAVKNAITVAKDWIVARFNDVVNFITGIPGRIAAFGRIMFDSVKNAITAAKDWIVARFNDAITFITGLPGRIAEFGRRMFDSVKEAALAVDRWIIEKFNDAVNFIKGIPGRIAEVAVNMFNSVKNAMTSAKDWVRDRVNDVVGFFTGLPGRIGRAVSSIKEKIMAPFKWVAEKVWNVFAGAVNWLGRKVGLPEIPKINLTGKAKGGRVPGGWGGGDQVPALLEPGEWVLTKHQARGIGYHRLRNLPHYQAGGEVGGGGHVPIMPTFGFGDVWDAAKSIGVGVLGNIEDVFDSVTGYLRRAAFVAFEKLTSPLRSLLEKAANDPHYFKSAIARFGVKILDNTLEFIRGKTEPELNVGGMRIDDVVKTVRDRFPQLVVTSALRRGDPGYHGRNLARDLGGPAGVMAAAGTWIQQTLAAALLEGIHNPTLSVKNGRVVAPSFWGGATWANHRDHIHLASEGAAAIAGNVGNWIAQAIRATGVNPAVWTSALATQIQRESGGNPRAINRTDINARMGDPSRGLMQVIGANFRAYGLPQLGNDIFNPLANIVAAIRYIFSRYGAGPNTLGRWRPGGPYDNGGFLPPGRTLAVNNSRRPEPVFTGGQWDVLRVVAEQAIRGESSRRDAPLMNIERATFTDEVDVTLLNRKLAWLAATEAAI